MSMKVLITCDRDSFSNPYVPTLADGLISIGCDVVCSIDEFWNNASNYDVIHIQWPNLLVQNMGVNGIFLEKVLKLLKEKNIPIIVTLHNLVPHYNHSPKILRAYEIVYKNADCFIHLGPISIELLKAKWPGLKAKHVVIPHHTYDSLYNMNISKLESRKKLGIPYNAKCILCFGAFRNDEERNIIINLSRNAKDDYYYLIPGFYITSLIHRNIFNIVKSLCNIIKYSIVAKKNNFHISHHLISDKKLPLFLTSADVLIVQRLKILNSGNVSLAMLAGLPIVGPNVGNVGNLLKNTGNACFEIDHLEELPNIVEKILKRKDQGAFNKKFAKDNLSTGVIAKKTKKVYEDLIKGFK